MGDKIGKPNCKSREFTLLTSVQETPSKDFAEDVSRLLEPPGSSWTVPFFTAIINVTMWRETVLHWLTKPVLVVLIKKEKQP